jgi:hypothetical protein
VKARLWWADQDSKPIGDELIPMGELARWFRDTAQTFKSTTAEGRPAPGVPPPGPEIYWHGENGRACPCAGCCAGAAVVLFDPATQALTKTGRKRSLSA